MGNVVKAVFIISKKDWLRHSMKEEFPLRSRNPIIEGDSVIFDVGTQIDEGFVAYVEEYLSKLGIKYKLQMRPHGWFK